MLLLLLLLRRRRRVVDIRQEVLLWGSDKEIARWKELRASKDKAVTDLEIPELVLSEDWPSKAREELKNLWYYLHTYC